MFLEPDKSLYTCNAENCHDCGLSDKLVCHFNIIQLFGFLFVVSPSFIIAGIIIIKFNPFLLFPWVVLILSYFGFVEIRVMCSHCPHYAESEIKTLKCWANYGSPKLWKYRPGPMSLSEKIIFYLGFTIILIYPITFFILENSYIFLGLYFVFIILSKLALNKYYCTHCINFSCPLNNVNEEIRNKFFRKNPIVRETWKKIYTINVRRL